MSRGRIVVQRSPNPISSGSLTIGPLYGAGPRIGSIDRHRDQFPGVLFGALPGLPPVDAGGQPPGNDPVRLGAGNMASFSSIGTASTGSLYIRGRQRAQYVVRIYGDTGKTRILKFDNRSGALQPQ